MVIPVWAVAAFVYSLVPVFVVLKVRSWPDSAGTEGMAVTANLMASASEDPLSCDLPKIGFTNLAKDQVHMETKEFLLTQLSRHCIDRGRV